MFFRRPLPWLVLLLPTLAFAAPGTQPAQTRPAGSGEAVLQQGALEWEPLERVFVSIRIEDLTLDEALDHVRDAALANIVLDTRVLETAGVHLKRTAKIRLWDVTLEQVLRILLPLYSRDLELRWEPRENIVFISTAEGILSTTTKMYDVRLLIDLIRASYVAQATAVPEDHHGLRTREESVEEIVRVMQELVDPDSWRQRRRGGRRPGVGRSPHRDADAREPPTLRSVPATTGEGIQPAAPTPVTRPATPLKPAEPLAR